MIDRKNHKAGLILAIKRTRDARALSGDSSTGLYRTVIHIADLRRCAEPSTPLQPAPSSLDKRCGEATMNDDAQLCSGSDTDAHRVRRYLVAEIPRHQFEQGKRFDLKFRCDFVRRQSSIADAALEMFEPLGLFGP